MTDSADAQHLDPTAPRESGPDWYTDLLSAPPETTPRRSAGLVAATIAVVMLLVAGVASAVALSGQQANTPEAAVRGLLTAAGNGDALGILDHLDPAERDAIAGFLTNGVGDLKRLGIVSPDLQLGHVPGISFTLSGLTATTSGLRPGLAAVKITGGTVHSRLSPAQLPLGPFTRDVAGKALAAAKPSDRTQPLRSDTSIVTIRRGSTWYVSVGYTAAEAARAAAKAPLPRVADSVPAVGANSSTAAVDAFIRATAALDVRRLVELTPPDEMGALHDYASLFLPKATDAIAKLQGGPTPVSVTITDLSLSSTPHAGGALVKVTRLGVRVSYKGSTIELAPGAKCLTVTGTVTSFPGACGQGGGAATAAAAAVLSGPLKALTSLRPDVGVVTVRRNGKWFVSPTRTILDDTDAVLHALTPEALQSLKALFNLSNVMGSVSTSSGGVTANGFAPVGSPAMSSPTGGMPVLGRPTLTRCVNGTRTVTFPTVPGATTPPPMTIPCTPAQPGSPAGS